MTKDIKPEVKPEVKDVTKEVKKENTIGDMTEVKKEVPVETSAQIKLKQVRQELKMRVEQFNNGTDELARLKEHVIKLSGKEEVYAEIVKEEGESKKS